MRKEPRPGEIYRHFKGRLYQVIAVAIHSETEEKMVVYQALYGTYQVFVRPLLEFISDTDRTKYPDAQQPERFQIWSGPEGHGEKEQDAGSREAPMPELDMGKPGSWENPGETMREPQGENVLMMFLEAHNCKEKFDILVGREDELDEHILNSIMVSLDLAITENSLEDRLDQVKDYLQTRMHFEDSRIR